MSKTSKKKASNLNKIRAVLIGLLLLVLGGLGGWALGYRTGKLQEDSGRPSLEEVVNRQSDETKVDFSLFWDVWGRLERSFLDQSKLNAQKMVYGAIEGMTGALGDPYTSFLPPSENKQTKQDLAGEFAGVGIQLGYKDETLAVIAPLEGHPAIDKGVEAGDLIMHIKDENKDIDTDTKGMSLPEAVRIIRGKKGEPVTLTLYSKGDEESREVTIVRDTIVVPTVELTFVDKAGETVETGTSYAHLKVARFGEKTASEWEESVDEILSRGDVRGVVLDLRNNPGGYLQRAVDLAGEFVSPGSVVVQEEGREEIHEFKADRRGRLQDTPLVVLVNEGSASASEILAGALRDQVGAKLVGENTFGKGTVQEAQELRGGAGLHVTIARWLLPSGDNIHESGLEPDVVVENERVDGELVDRQLEKAIEVLSEQIVVAGVEN